MAGKASARFAGKVCVVTGGGSGIGRATCLRFAREGGRVAIIDRDADGGEETRRLIAETGAEVRFMLMDVAQSSEVREAADGIVQAWGRVDVLVNNAATMVFAPVVDLADEQWDSVLGVSLRAAFVCCRSFLPYMRSGAIVNVSSVHAHATTRDVAPYAAAKAGLEALTRALSREHDVTRVRVNAVAPGAVDTPMLWENPNVRSEAEEIEGPVASPDEIAAVIAFLASEDASFVHGATLLADGGRLAAL